MKMKMKNIFNKKSYCAPVPKSNKKTERPANP